MQAMRSRRCRMHPKWQLGSPASDRTWLGLHANLSKYVLIIFCTFLWIDSSRPLIYWCCCSTEIRKPSLSTGHSPFSSAKSMYLLLSLKKFSPLWFSFVWHYHVANAMELCCKQCVSITISFRLALWCSENATYKLPEFLTQHVKSSCHQRRGAKVSHVMETLGTSPRLNDVSCRAPVNKSVEWVL